jgi:hypothetical protein
MAIYLMSLSALIGAEFQRTKKISALITLLHLHAYIEKTKFTHVMFPLLRLVLRLSLK